MRKILYIFFLFVTSASAQLINNNPIDVTVGPTAFNPSFLKENKICSIKIIMVDKPDGEMIIDKGATQAYEFDESGKIIRYYYTIPKNVTKEEVEIPAIIRRGRVIRKASSKTITHYINDTIFANIYYDVQNRIILKRTRVNDYYDAYYYEYNEEGKLKKELHCKETNVSENKNEFKLGTQTILSLETYEYEKLSKTQTKKKCLNDEGKEYKKVITNYDESGNIISENYSYIVSWMFNETTYEYDFADRVIKNTTSSNESGDVKTQKIFEYDQKGLLLSEKYLRNNELLTETSYLYDNNNNLITSRVVRDHKKSSIGIVKYIYTFY